MSDRGANSVSADLGRRQATRLAQAHRTEDPDTQFVMWSRDPTGTEVRLVEVSGSVGRTDEVLPFRFAPQGGELSLPTVLVLLNPDEWEAVKGGRLSLPEGWGSPDDLEQL